MNQTDQFNVKCGDQTPFSDREGEKVKHRTLANLSHCSDEEIEAIRIAFKMKKQIVYGLLTDEQGDTCCHEKEIVSGKESNVRQIQSKWD